MKQGRILAEKTCHDLEPGFYFFEDVLSVDILNFDNYRVVFFDEDFAALKESVGAQGVKVPIQIAFDTHSRQLTVLSGERRARAVSELRAAGVENVHLPCLVRVGDRRMADIDLDNTITAIVSNLHSQELTQVDKMRCYQTLFEKGMSKIEIARCVGKDRKTIERGLQLREFDDEVLDFISEKEKLGLLKSRNVEIIGQKLRKSLDDAKLEVLRAELPESERDDPTIWKTKIKQVELPKDQEEAIRGAAYQVLQEEVKRRESAKQPRSDEDRIEQRTRRADVRRVELSKLSHALEVEFDAEQIRKILAIIDELDQSLRKPSSTSIVMKDFAQVAETQILN